MQSMHRATNPLSLLGGRGSTGETEADAAAHAFTAGSSRAGPAFPLGAIAAAPSMPGTGKALPDSTRGAYEAHFGRDLGAVRVHDFPRSLAGSDANAFTIGTDIAFAPGKYSTAGTAGRSLLAHEIAHVLQQAGGGNGLSPMPTGIQADGKITNAEEQHIRDWVETDGGETDILLKQPGFNSTGQLSQDDALWLWAQMAYSGNSLKLHKAGAKFPSPFMDFPRVQPGQDLLGFDFDPVNAPYGKVPDDFEACPSCHQTRQQQYNEKQKKAAAKAKEEANRKAREELDRREAAWPRLHKTQHEVELANQATTMDDAIAMSVLAAADARLKLFDRALLLKSVMPSRSDGKTPRRVTEEMRDAFANVQRAAILLEALQQASKGPLPSGVTDPIEAAFVEFYKSLLAAMREADIDNQQAAFLRQQQLDQCPEFVPAVKECQSVSCHDPAPTPTPGPHSSGFASRALLGSPSEHVLSTLLLPKDRAKAKPVDPLADFVPRMGFREERLLGAVNMLCADPVDWGKHEIEFGWAVQQMDELLLAEVPEDWGNQDLIKTLKYTRDMEQAQRIFQRQHPEAIKVQAIYYPKYDVEKHQNQEGREEYSAKGIPWQLYLTQTPGPSGETADTGFEWQLHDMTSGNKAFGRSVRAKHQVTALEAYARDAFRERDPPEDLFKELNHKDYFPEGILYYKLPHWNSAKTVEMDEPWTFGDWLTYVGLAIAIIGSLVFAPFSTPALVAAAVGTGMTIAGRVVRHEEMKAAGVLRGGEENRLFFDVAMDVLSMITLGVGKVAQVARNAGNLMRAASATRAWFFLRSTQLAGDAVQVGIMVHDLVNQYDAIMKSNMSDVEKERALRKLTMMAMFAGALSFLPVYAGARELKQMSKLSLATHPETGKLVAYLADDAADAAHAGSRQLKGEPIRGAPFRDAEGEVHSHGLWPDGTITRCSPPPCDEVVDALVRRINRLALALQPTSPNAAEIRTLLWRAKMLRTAAKDTASRGEKALAEEGPALLKTARDIEDKFKSIKEAVENEHELLSRSGREAAVTRFGDDADNFNRDHYHWRRHADGTLTFHRSRDDVPFKEWVPANPDTGVKGHFKQHDTFFVKESQERLEELASTSATASLKPLATIDNGDDYRKFMMYRKGELEKGWILVRVDDDNFHHFSTEPLQRGEIRVYPDGNRHWRNHDGTISTENAVRLGIGRKHHETRTPPQERIGADGESNLGVPLEGGVFQRAHPAGGAGLGFDVPNHILFAAEEINQILQNKGIELFIRTLKKNHPDMDLRLESKYAAVKDTRSQAWIEYTLHIVENGEKRKLFGLRITANKYRKYKADLAITFATRNEADLKMLTAVDMKEAIKQLDAKVYEAMKRRKSRD